ncbi:hypothetical protein BGX31_003977 [Mortierella sp. GBA43]|nr:hypothetical protein BGX31_003977 [Mortierella sp. GBA43]
MFTMSASSALEAPIGVQAWMDDSHDMLLGNHEVLDYASFSDESSSPVLSLQSFSSQQHSPDLDAFAFPDFEPLTSTSAALTFPSLTNPVVANATTVSNDARSSATETARQAALLHAYLVSQDEIYRAQLQLQQQQRQQWNSFPALAPSNKEQNQQELEIVDKEQEKHKQQELERNITQKTDAENLARYLARIKEEETCTDGRLHASREDAMEIVDDTMELTRCPSSPLSTAAERSPSPEAAASSQQTIAPKDTANSHTATTAAVKTSTTTATVKMSSRQLICFNCQVTQTPLWRRTPDRKHSLCNACGLYYKQYGAHRPLNVRHKLSSVLIDPRLAALPYARPPPPVQVARSSPPPAEPSSSTSSDSDSDEIPTLPELTKFYADALLRPGPAKKTSPPLMTAKQGIACANCSQTQTPLWRKNDAGEPICNACGLYAKLHNRARPVTMRKSKITRRRRDWGGNLAHQAKAQAQALALFHAQVQAQIETQMKGNSNKDTLDITLPSSWSFENDPEDDSEMVDDKSIGRRGRKINGHGRHTSFSDSEEEVPSQAQPPVETLPQLQTKSQHRPLAPAPAPSAVPAHQVHPRILGSTLPLAPAQPQAQAQVQEEQEQEPSSQGQQPQQQQQAVAQKLAGNMIMDENKFSDVVEQMNAHQMNRFLSILESRCGVLRNRILACTDSNQNSSFEDLF